MEASVVRVGSRAKAETPMTREEGARWEALWLQDYLVVSGRQGGLAGTVLGVYKSTCHWGRC